MKPEHTRKVVGGASALLGLFWVWICTGPIFSGFWTGEREALDILFLLAIVPLMTVPGVLAIIFGVRLFIRFSESSLKLIVGIFAVFGACCLSFYLSLSFPDLFSKRLAGTAFLFASSLIAIPVYLFITRLLLRYFSKTERTFSTLLSRWVLILMALQLWSFLSTLFEEYLPRREGNTDLPEYSWGIMGFLVSIIVPYGFYRVLASRLTKAQQGEVVQPAPERESK